jgi:hypothetical protein
VRVALLCGDRRGHAAADELGRALRAAGHEALLLDRDGGAAEALLRRRGFTDALTALPLGAAALARGGFDVAHAFSPPDAAAALLRRRAPVVFTCVETLGRDRLADRRLRLALLRRAVEESDALVAPGEPAAAALARWLAVDARVLAPDDAEGHLHLYRDLLATGARRAASPGSRIPTTE